MRSSTFIEKYRQLAQDRTDVLKEIVDVNTSYQLAFPERTMHIINKNQGVIHHIPETFTESSKLENS